MLRIMFGPRMLVDALITGNEIRARVDDGLPEGATIVDVVTWPDGSGGIARIDLIVAELGDVDGGDTIVDKAITVSTLS